MNGESCGACDAGRLVALLTSAGRTVAVAESLTGGAVTDAIVAVSGASRCLRGSVVAYATDLKAGLLGVPQELIDRHGAVSAEVAAAMASGVRERLGADYGIGTTGVAGPALQDGQPPGTYHVAVEGPWGGEVVSMCPEEGTPSSRSDVRDAARDAARARARRRAAHELRSTDRHPPAH